MVGIALGVGLLHFVTGPDYRGPLRDFVNGYLIDILLPFAMYLLLSLPQRPLRLPTVGRALAVLAVGGVVELLQFLGVPVFGSTFDPLDLMMYAAGVGGGVAFERLVLARMSTDAGGQAVAAGGRSDGDVE